MKLRSIQLLVNKAGDIIIGSGRMAIFESIQRTGPINQTTKELKMAGICLKNIKLLKKRCIKADDRIFCQIFPDST